MPGTESYDRVIIPAGIIHRKIREEHKRNVMATL